VFDFYVVQALAGPHLLDGGNPYAMTFPDLSGGTSPHLDPSLMGGGQLLFGFIYPPLSLLCLLPVQLVGGDYRYAMAAAYTAAGGLVGYCRPGRGEAGGGPVPAHAGRHADRGRRVVRAARRADARGDRVRRQPPAGRGRAAARVVVGRSSSTSR
jgi:hypothetical protein